MDGQLLDQIIARVNGLAPEARAELASVVAKATAGKPFIPNFGPQERAYHSKADILLFGGHPGSSKTALLAGLALNQHERSLLVRRQFADLEGMIDCTKRIAGTADGFVGGGRPLYNKPDGGVVHFQGINSIGDFDTSKQGNPHDFIGVDEGAQLPLNSVMTLIGWNRTTKKGQRCRMVIASNPPLDSIGEWMGEFFAPWLDDTHPKPAEDGELRWFIIDRDSKNREVPDGNPITIDGRTYYPLSRSYISSKLTDNPFIDTEDYQRRLDATPEPWRTILQSGNFMLARQDSEHQVIPRAWVKEAQARWTPQPPEGVPMCAMGVDVTGGGDDFNVLAPRYDGYFPPLVVVPGRDTPNGEGISGLILQHRRDNAAVVIDMGGGFGNLPFVELKNNDIAAVAHKGSEGSNARTKDLLWGFYNKRSEVIWRLREALDPHQKGGSIICLPPDQQLVADLTSFLYDVVPHKGRSCVKIETKEEMVSRLGRSPDRGDAVVMAWSAGRTIANTQGGWQAPKGRTLVAKMGHDNRRRGQGR